MKTNYGIRFFMFLLVLGFTTKSYSELPTSTPSRPETYQAASKPTLPIYKREANPSHAPRILKLRKPDKGLSFDESCQTFIGASGEPGVMGTKILNRISSQPYLSKCFYEQADWSIVCPKFKEFEDTKKQDFVLWFFASLSDAESQCTQDYRMAHIHGESVGYFRLEGSAEQRRMAGRDPVACETSRKESPQWSATNLDFQTNCSVAIFKSIYCDRKVAVGERSTYWEGLFEPKSRGIKLAKAFPSCK